MNVIICDDNGKDLCLMEEYVREYFDSRHTGSRILCFSDASEISEDVLTDCDVLFVDIYMPNSNGVEFVKKNRDNSEYQIVFVTMSMDHAIDAFNVDSRHYILKPINKNDIVEALDRCLKFIGKNPDMNERCIEVKTTSGKMPVSFGCIHFIDILNTKVTIHTDGDPVRTYSALGDIYEQLDSSLFIRANRSYIVNMDYIRSFNSDHIVLKNGLSVSLSRKNRKDMREQYHNYLIDKVRNGR